MEVLEVEEALEEGLEVVLVVEVVLGLAVV